MDEHPVFSFFPQLSSELELLEPLLEDKPREAAMRLYIRTSFAMLEAIGSGIRDKAAKALMMKYVNGDGPIEISRIHFLQDFGMKVGSNGKIEEKSTSDTPFSAHFALGIRALADAVGCEVNHVQGSGWAAFLKAIKIRNRITHPKTEEDIAISKDDFELVNEGIWWAFETIFKILEHPNDIFQKQE